MNFQPKVETAAVGCVGIPEVFYSYSLRSSFSCWIERRYVHFERNSTKSYDWSYSSVSHIGKLIELKLLDTKYEWGPFPQNGFCGILRRKCNLCRMGLFLSKQNDELDWMYYGTRSL